MFSNGDGGEKMVSGGRRRQKREVNLRHGAPRLATGDCHLQGHLENTGGNKRSQITDSLLFLLSMQRYII